MTNTDGIKDILAGNLLCCKRCPSFTNCIESKIRESKTLDCKELDSVLASIKARLPKMIPPSDMINYADLSFNEGIAACKKALFGEEE